MKKVLLTATLLAAIVLSATACGSQTTTQREESATSSIATETEEGKTETVKADTEETESKEWKKFLKEYEEWVDKYVKILKKYNENPGDMSILSDYTKMAAELAKWQTKTDEVQKELEDASPEELAEYSAELLRIAAKISEAAY